MRRISPPGICACSPTALNSGGGERDGYLSAQRPSPGGVRALPRSGCRCGCPVLRRHAGGESARRLHGRSLSRQGMIPLPRCSPFAAAGYFDADGGVGYNKKNMKGFPLGGKLAQLSRD